jgi:hypothetical protein
MLFLLLLEENDRIRTQTFLHGLFRDSRLPNRVNEVPRYDTKTLVKGSMLGKGTFCSVYKFRRGVLFNKDGGRDETISTTTESCNSEKQFDGKLMMTTSLKKPWLSQLPLRKVWSRLNCLRSTPKYVIKTMNKDNLDTESRKMFVRSVAYLAADKDVIGTRSSPHNTPPWLGLGFLVFVNDPRNRKQRRRRQQNNVPMWEFHGFGTTLADPEITIGAMGTRTSQRCRLLQGGKTIPGRCQDHRCYRRASQVQTEATDRLYD